MEGSSRGAEAAPPTAGQTRPGILSKPKAQESSRAGSTVDEPDDVAPTAAQPSAVRFSSAIQEIEPRESLAAMTTTSDAVEGAPNRLENLEALEALEPVEEETRQTLRMVSQSLERHRTNNNCTFEPVSLPPSRVPTDTGSRAQSRAQSPALKPLPGVAQSPAAALTDGQPQEAKVERSRLPSDAGTMTPQISPFTGMPLQPDQPDRGGRGWRDDSGVSTAPSSRPSTPGPHLSSRPTTVSTRSADAALQQAHRARSLAGPSSMGESGLPSSALTSYTQENYTGSSTSFTKPLLAQGDKDDPYARSKRAPQPKGRENIDARFVFNPKETKRAHGHHSRSSSGLLSRVVPGGTDAQSKGEKRLSFGRRKENHPQHEARGSDESHNLGGSSKHSSMTELKRFFGFSHRSKRGKSPLPFSKSRRPGNRTPQQIVPFGEDHGLATRYGKLGKVLGSGAGGSVRLMKRSTDGVTFAAKEFRPRHATESVKKYAKKVTAEFCVGSALHHGNVIETLDLVQEKGKWYTVMELAPFDLFAVVMSGRMSRAEVTCSFLQIFAGVTYLHSVGLAHRDLKLDNVVINEHGIMKIIDFGSSTVFRYPFENDIVLAQDVVGSDPYLAPEVYETKFYNPQPCDIWSLGIIFCCMIMRKFPWKFPRMSDSAFRLFAAPPAADDSDLEQIARRGRRLAADDSGAGDLIPPPPVWTFDEPGAARGGAERESTTPAAGSLGTSPPRSREASEVAHASSTSTPRLHEQQVQQQQQQQAIADSTSSQLPAASPAIAPTGRPDSPSTDAATSTAAAAQGQTEAELVVRGPWRILRSLPRESRHVIGRMLDVDPRTRATIEELLLEPWVANSHVCRQEDMADDEKVESDDLFNKAAAAAAAVASSGATTPVPTPGPGATPSTTNFPGAVTTAIEVVAKKRSSASYSPRLGSRGSITTHVAGPAVTTATAIASSRPTSGSATRRIRIVKAPGHVHSLQGTSDADVLSARN